MTDTHRPQTLNEYIGQAQVKAQLTEIIKAAKTRHEPIRHLLLTGGAGTGKTTLANIIANHMGGKFIETVGLNLRDASTIYKLLLTLQPGDILFVDEIHDVQCAEALYRAVEDGKIEVMVQQGKVQANIQIKLPRFTLIGATTDPSRLPKPMRDRMLEIHLAPYLDSEIAQIATRAFAVRGMTTDESTIAEITKRARATPRKVNEFAEYIRDLAQNRNSSAVPVALALQAFDMLEIDGLGLNALDRKYLHTIITKYDGGKVGIDTLAATMSEDRNALVKMTEPYLLATGLIEVAKGGRVATQAAYRHLNIES